MKPITIPGTKTHPHRCVVEHFGRILITKANDRETVSTWYDCTEVGFDAVNLTKADGTTYRTTKTTCSCPSRVPCCHIAAVRTLADQGVLFNHEDMDTDAIDSRAELVEEMDDYFNRLEAF